MSFQMYFQKTEYDLFKKLEVDTEDGPGLLCDIIYCWIEALTT